jgi:hypothetical protein
MSFKAEKAGKPPAQRAAGAAAWMARAGLACNYKKSYIRE